MHTQQKPVCAPKSEKTTPARDRFRKQIRTGVTAGEPGGRLFDSQNQNGGETLPPDAE
jgi:hypothetical protein